MANGGHGEQLDCHGRDCHPAGFPSGLGAVRLIRHAPPGLLDSRGRSCPERPPHSVRTRRSAELGDAKASPGRLPHPGGTVPKRSAKKMKARHPPPSWTGYFGWLFVAGLCVVAVIA